MGVVSRLVRGLAHPSPSLFAGLAPPATRSGARVSPSTALAAPAVLSCVRAIAETVASLPLPVYERLERGKRRAVGHPLYRVLHDQPNPEMTSYSLRETLQAHVETWGNAWAYIELGGAGQVIGLWPLPPDKTHAYRVEGSGRLAVRSFVKGRDVSFHAEEVFRLHGLGFDGVTGYSPIALAREAIGLSLSAEEYAARFYSNNAMPGGVLEHPKSLSPEAHATLRKSWADLHAGPENAWKMAILEEGMKLHNLAVPQRDAQFLETRKFQTNEIARIFRIPPHMIGDHEKGATFASVEQQALDFVKHSIRPRLVRWEQAIATQLVLPSERDRYFAEFLLEGLLRGETKTRYEAYQIGVQNGWLSPNEVRELENLNPREGGDEYLTPLNMRPSSGAEPAEPAAADDDDEPTTDEGDERAVRAAAVVDESPRCMKCSRLLAHRLARPWTLACPRCKTVNEQGLDDLAA